MSASIGAIAALIVPFLKDFLFQSLNERRVETRRQEQVSRNYLAPLSDACQKLIWRFSEIFIEDRHQWLKTTTLPLEYNEYKRHSTLYRIASLVGWIRAIDLELSALPRSKGALRSPVSEGVSQVQSALADGPHVEVHRLESVCSILRLGIDDLSEERKQRLATRLEVALYDAIGPDRAIENFDIENLELGRKKEICQRVSDFLCGELGKAKIDRKIVAESTNSLIRGLTYREALIYRDWQDAIGDMILVRDSDSIRKFKIRGFAEFEQILEADLAWIKTFKKLVADVDFETRDANDFRAKQLLRLAQSVSAILIEIATTKEGDLVPDKVLELARKLTAIEHH